MADSKISGLPADIAPALTDVTVTDNDTGGTPVTSKSTWAQIQAVITPPASVTVAGRSEYATAAEIDSATASRTMTPDLFVASKRNIRYLMFVLVDSADDVATDTDIGGDFTIPFSGTILQDDTLHDQLAATTDTAGTTGTMVVDIHLNGTTIMATNKLDILSTKKGTQTNGTQPDLTTTAISAGNILTFDIDAVHTTTAKGLKVLMAIRES